MTRKTFFALAASMALLTAPATAEPGNDAAQLAMSTAAVMQMSLQCVPYARTVSGIQIHGDAHTWWGKAEGHYARGLRPKVGAVMALKPYGKMELGHVAAISRIVDNRTVLLRHANWSLINGTRGQIEDDVRAVDVSPANDWSQVRVWFAPLQGLGGTAWPVQGFIYNEKPRKSEKLTRPKAAPAEMAAPAMRPRLSPAVRSLAGDKRYANDPIGAIIAASLRR